MAIDFNNAIYLRDIPRQEYKNYFSNGYRTVCYRVDSDRQGQIILFGYDLENQPKVFIIPHQSYIKYNVKYKTNETDVYGNYVATKYFKNVYERKKYIDNVNGLNIVECLKPESEFLQEMFGKISLEPSFNKQPLRIHYLDIETEMSGAFMKPSEAGNRINMITIFDTLTNKFYTWSLEHAEIKFDEEPLNKEDPSKFVFFEFHNNEESMLAHFIDWFESNYPDVISGYNTQGYDIPYIVRRIENVFGKNDAKRLSPVDRYYIKEVNHDNARADVSAEIEVTIEGIFNCDLLLLYRDKFLISPALDGGYSLDNVGEHEGLGHKIKYNGTLKDLYLNNYQKFYEYNVRDVDLVKRLDEKCNILQLARGITSFGLTNYNAIYSSIGYLMGSIISFARNEMNGKIFNSYLKEKKHFDGFEGAFVFPTNPILVRDGIACIDFASLYPSNIRAVNASPETYVGKLLIYRKDESGNITCNFKDELAFNVNDDEVVNDPNIVKFELKLPNEQRKQITIPQIRKLLQEKCIYTANNTFFLKHEVKWGTIALWCQHFYNLRKKTKKEMMKHIHDLHKREDSLSKSEKYEIESKIGSLNTNQYALKTMLNSVYGMLGTSFSPIANPDIAQTITRQGKFANISTSEFILKYFQETYGASKDYKVAISGDTDSQFINLQCVTKYLREKYNLPRIIRDWDQKYRQELWDMMNTFVNNDVNNFVRTLVANYCHTNHSSVLTYELEYMSDVGIYESKKHYATHKIFDEGDAVDKTKYSGIELKKAQIPKELKVYLAEIYNSVLLKNWEETDYQNYISDLYTKFQTFDIEEISFWKGYSTERQSTGFLQMQLGTTGIAKACNYYNQLLEKFKITNKYETIRVGDKVRFLYIDDCNPYNINCIAYKSGQYPEEFKKVFKPDYYKMFTKIILDPLKKFREACKFSDMDPSKQNVFDIFNL
jgi:DNA polymerase elongation subunit (family B)